MKLLLIFGLIAAVQLISVAAPGANPSEPVIMLHAEYPPCFTLPCSGPPLDIRCRDYAVDWPLNCRAEVYLLAVDFDVTRGISEFCCGLDYDGNVGVGVDVFAWTLGADAQMMDGTWGEPGSGNRLLWDVHVNCQEIVVDGEEVVAVAGCFYLYAYSADVLRIVPNPHVEGGPELSVTDCEGTDRFLASTSAGEIAFGSPPGTAYNPCADSVPVGRTSWGAVKALY